MEPDPLDKEDLLTQLGVWFQTQIKTRELANQMTLNLLHCLTELHVDEVTKVVAPEIKRLNLFKMKLSVVDCATLYYVLQFSPHRLDELNLGYSNIGNRGLHRLGPILHRCESLFLRYNCLDQEAAILESAVLKSEDCQVKKLFICGKSLGSEGVLELWPALEHNVTVEELYLDITGITERGTETMVKCLTKNSTLKTLTLVGNEIGEAGKDRLGELRRRRPELHIIGDFVDDLGLLQAYLDWVEEIRADRDQMDSVRNVDALQSVLKGLRVTGARGEGQNAQKAKEPRVPFVMAFILSMMGFFWAFS
ncbi:nucleotide-binding oligomerization domain-containing protein 2-like isoform X2 [Conger conger]|uniref:nucleotide-binding oligomerization domain-containing protein 2-like isoform X2 n=1 Tax=Conger conger TaxID=82655 RepID=UPI002A59DFFD|nr:nucleotide-binding oligomerization domain-containing protein 2-like isoform X2 [Conger conger]